METGVLRIWWQPLGRLVLAALGGALLTGLLLLLFYIGDGLTVVAPPVVLTGAELQLAAGQGEHTAAGLQIRQPDAQGLSVVQGPVQRMVRAALYPHLSWQVEGLAPGSEMRLAWVTLAEPRTVRERLLPAQAAGSVDLGTDPHWRGRIAMMGLMVRGPLAEPLLVQRLELRPVTRGSVGLWRWAVGEWSELEDWSQRSINYIAGAPLDALFYPVLVVALWVGLSVVLYILLAWPAPASRGWKPYAALFLLGWLVLDLRWQWDLSQRVQQTEARFAGKSGDEQRLAATDGDLYRFLLDVRRHLPEMPVRIFIVSADPAENTTYEAGRARYHLLPHNGYAGLSRPPDARVAVENSYVLILSPVPGIRYDRNAQVLEWENGQLPVELRYVAPAGALFRVRGG